MRHFLASVLDIAGPLGAAHRAHRRWLVQLAGARVGLRDTRRKGLLGRNQLALRASAS